MLPFWTDLVLAAVAALALAAYFAERRRTRRLATLLTTRERRGHFLGEAPDLPRILKHAFAAADEVLPVDGFRLYRVGPSGQIEEVWSVTRTGEGPEPVLEAASPHLGETIDASRLRQLTATETDHSFAPSDLLSGGPASRRLRLPLYSGDRLIAHLDLTSRGEIDDAQKEEIRSLLGPLTASLHAFRNWTIAVTDELSGLASRRYFETRLTEEWARRDRYGGRVAVAIFDLDHFKSLNDGLGHAAGDAAIRRFGGIVAEAIRGSDIACRYGGEEFAILFPETAASAASGVAERIRAAVESERFVFAGSPFRVTVSAGIAEAFGTADSRALLVRADEALYAAKAAGRNTLRVWGEGEASQAPLFPALPRPDGGAPRLRRRSRRTKAPGRPEPPNPEPPKL